MTTIRRSILALLMAFSLLGLAACDNGVEEGVGEDGAAIEEPLATDEAGE